VLATLVAVYGLFMPPIGWGWALMVWGYSLVWFLVNDRVKLLGYRILDPAGAKLKPEDKAGGPRAEAKNEAKPEIKTEPTPNAKAETPTDLTPQIATRAYELYEQEGRRDGHSAQDWEKAEREIQEHETHK
jgi:H+-transporting ATPase